MCAFFRSKPASISLAAALALPACLYAQYPAASRKLDDLVPSQINRLQVNEDFSWPQKDGIIYFPTVLDYFDLHSNQVWKCGGTPGTTQQMTFDGLPNAPIRMMGALDSGVYAIGREDFAPLRLFKFDPESATATGVEPWVSDGTAAGTHLVHETAAGTASRVSYYNTPVTMGGRLLFSATDPEHSLVPWSSDGTPGGTRSLQGMLPESRYPVEGSLFPSGDVLYFTVANNTDDPYPVPAELWAMNTTGPALFHAWVLH